MARLSCGLQRREKRLARHIIGQPRGQASEKLQRRLVSYDARRADPWWLATVEVPNTGASSSAILGVLFLPSTRHQCMGLYARPLPLPPPGMCDEHGGAWLAHGNKPACPAIRAPALSWSTRMSTFAAKKDHPLFPQAGLGHGAGHHSRPASINIFNPAAHALSLAPRACQTTFHSPTPTRHHPSPRDASILQDLQRASANRPDHSLIHW